MEQIDFGTFIRIDKNDQSPIFMQVVQQTILAIQQGLLLSQSKLPGTRHIARQIGLNRNTVVAAIKELANQNWLQIKPNIGTFVSADRTAKSRHDSHNAGPYPIPSTAAYTFEESQLLDQYCSPLRSFLYQLDSGVPDERLIPFSKIAGIFSACTKRANAFRYCGHAYEYQADSNFKQSLCNYINYGLKQAFLPRNLLVSRSHNTAKYLVAKALIRPSDTVVSTHLGDQENNMIFQLTGAQIKTIPMEHDGPALDHLEALCKNTKIRLLYLSTRHHFPTTWITSQEKRLRIIDLAEKYDFIIVEDDFEAMFNFGRSILPTLIEQDPYGRVIYLHHFGTGLTPNLRYGLVFAAENLIRELSKYLFLLDRENDSLSQQVLTELIDDGVLSAFHKKSLKLYNERRNIFATQMVSQLGDVLSLHIPESGLAIWTEWDKKINLAQLTKKIEKQGIILPNHLVYQSKSLSGIRFGFASKQEKEIRKIIEIIKKEV